MNIKFKRDVIVDPLSAVCAAANRRGDMPILSHVLFDVRDGVVQMTATDMEVSTSTTSECDGDDGVFAAPAEKLQKIIKALPRGADISMSIGGDGKAIIKSGKSKFTLQTLSADEFPSMPMINKQVVINVSQNDLKKALNKVSFASADKDVRYYLNGALFDVSNGEVKIVTTDGHRLAISKCDGVVDIDGDGKFIVPNRGAGELSKLLSGGDCEISFGKNHMSVEMGGFSFTSKLIDGQFPDYHRVIPANENKIICNTMDALSAFKRVAVLSNQKYKGVRIDVSSDSLDVEANNEEMDHAVETLAADFDGEPFNIGFNVQYLIDAISQIDCERVVFNVGDAGKAAYIHGEHDLNSSYVVMPMRV